MLSKDGWKYCKNLFPVTVSKLSMNGLVFRELYAGVNAFTPPSSLDQISNLGHDNISPATVSFSPEQIFNSYRYINRLDGTPGNEVGDHNNTPAYETIDSPTPSSTSLVPLTAIGGPSGQAIYYFWLASEEELYYRIQSGLTINSTGDIIVNGVTKVSWQSEIPPPVIIGSTSHGCDCPLKVTLRLSAAISYGLTGNPPDFGFEVSPNGSVWLPLSELNVSSIKPKCINIIEWIEENKQPTGIPTIPELQPVDYDTLAKSIARAQLYSVESRVETLSRLSNQYVAGLAVPPGTRGEISSIQDRGSGNGHVSLGGEFDTGFQNDPIPDNPNGAGDFGNYALTVGDNSAGLRLMNIDLSQVRFWTSDGPTGQAGNTAGQGNGIITVVYTIYKC